MMLPTRLAQVVSLVSWSKLVKSFITFMGMGAGPSEGCYEMSVGNADKGMLPFEEIKRRVQPFIEENLPIVLTQVMQPPQAVCLLLAAMHLACDML